MPKSIYQHYQQLLQEYGDPVNYWPQWCAKSKSTEEREKAAVTIFLYELEKPFFIIDKYPRRWVEKEGLIKEKDYSKLQQFFHINLKSNLNNYQNFHTLIIVSQRG